jgi:hypothetical protein
MKQRVVKNSMMLQVLNVSMNDQSLENDNQLLIFIIETSIGNKERCVLVCLNKMFLELY